MYIKDTKKIYFKKREKISRYYIYILFIKLTKN